MWAELYKIVSQWEQSFVQPALFKWLLKAYHLSSDYVLNELASMQMKEEWNCGNWMIIFRVSWPTIHILPNYHSPQEFHRMSAFGHHVLECMKKKNQRQQQKKTPQHVSILFVVIWVFRRHSSPMWLKTATSTPRFSPKISTVASELELHCAHKISVHWAGWEMSPKRHIHNELRSKRVKCQSRKNRPLITHIRKIMKHAGLMCWWIYSKIQDE